LRVVILSNIPEVPAMLATSLRRLGHQPAATIVANRRLNAPGNASILDGNESGTEVVVVADKDSIEPTLKSFEPDLAVSWAFPWRIPAAALRVPNLGSINFHPSLLPRHRGPFPLAWTVRMGDESYGATWHRMDPEFDTGHILAQQSTPVSVEDSASEVISRLSFLGVRMLRSVLRRVTDGDPGEAQSSEDATEERVFGSDYAYIDWSSPKRSIHDQVRAWAFMEQGGPVIGPLAEIDGRLTRIIATTLRTPGVEAQRVECGDGPIWILESEPSDVLVTSVNSVGEVS
jgi:methionyl-tRNA formyltransferase